MQRNEIESILAPINGATFAALDTVTVPVLKGGKGNPFQGKIEKHCFGNRVMLFTNKYSSGYENMVKRHLEQAGLDPETFQAGELPWGKRVPNSPFIENEGNLYLQTVFLKAGDVSYHAIEEFSRMDVSNLLVTYPKDSEISKYEIQGLSDRTGSEHQGLERSKQVIVRTYAIDSIVGIRAFGQVLPQLV